MTMKILIAFALIFTLGWTALAAQEDAETVPVIVVTGPVARGTVLLPDLLAGPNAVVEVQQWKAEFAPETAFHQLEDLEGLVVRIDLAARTPLLAGNLVVEAPQAAAIGSDTALMMPPGTVAVPLFVSNLAAAPPTLGETDCVRIDGVFNFGGQLAETRLPLAAVGVVVENVAGSGMVTVATDRESAVTLIWAQQNSIRLWLDFSEGC
jgi:hypothetical protein